MSPVFNIRGKQIIGVNTPFGEPIDDLSKDINYEDNYTIEHNLTPIPENAKGVFKLDLEANLDSKTFDGANPIKPIGIKINFANYGDVDVINGYAANLGLKDLTKGFFIVRQKRIPTILAQGVGIATSKKCGIPTLNTVDRISLLSGYYGQSFLKLVDLKPKLGTSGFTFTEVYNNALLCPEASVKRTLYNSFFNSSEFVLKETKFVPLDTVFINKYANYQNFALDRLTQNIPLAATTTTNLTLIEPGIELIKNGNYSFSSQAGSQIEVYKYLDPK